MKYRVRMTHRAKIQLAEAAAWWASHRSADETARWIDGFDKLAAMTLAEMEERLTRVERELKLMQPRERRCEQPNPWIRMQGTLPDDDLAEQWRIAMDDYRRQKDEEARPE